MHRVWQVMTHHNIWWYLNTSFEEKPDSLWIMIQVLCFIVESMLCLYCERYIIILLQKQNKKITIKPAYGVCRMNNDSVSHFVWIVSWMRKWWVVKHWWCKWYHTVHLYSSSLQDLWFLLQQRNDSRTQYDQQLVYICQHQIVVLCVLNDFAALHFGVIFSMGRHRENVEKEIMSAILRPYKLNFKSSYERSVLFTITLFLTAPLHSVFVSWFSLFLSLFLQLVWLFLCFRHIFNSSLTLFLLVLAV